jgi:exonuclease III
MNTGCKITTVNCNGLADKRKRVNTLKWVKRSYPGIILLQETHTSEKTEDDWKTDIGQTYAKYFSHGSTSKAGVATLIPRKLEKHVIDIKTDENGRLLLMLININNAPHVIMNVYFPTQDKPKEQKQFLLEIDGMLKGYSNYPIIIGGDFNIVLNPLLDKYNSKSDEKCSNLANDLKEFMSMYNLFDVWRIRNPHTKKFTWRRIFSKKNKAGFEIQQSRIDLILISDTINSNMKDEKIGVSFASDHCPVSIDCIPSNTSPRGKGLWKLNNSLLLDEEYVFIIENLIEKHCDEILEIPDPRVGWEYLKMLVRRESIAFSIRKKLNQNREKNFLLFELKDLEKKISETEHPNDDLLTEYTNVKKDIDRIEQETTNGCIVRSKIAWIEHGEKSSAFFLNLEKHNGDLKHITTIGTDIEHLVSKPAEVLDCLYDYYSNLYARNRNINEENFENFNADVKLNSSDKKLLDQYISLEECKEALDALPSGKTPGTDGISTEFLKKFWSSISTHFYKALQCSIKEGMLSVEQRRAVISLIPKDGKDSRLINNWRPISVTNVDYKIIAKVIANRLKIVLPMLINEDQCGYVQNRVIGENVRFLHDLMYSSNQGEVEGIIMLVDFEKAFDSVDWSFLMYTLDNFNFGSYFKGLVQMLYNEITSTVINNGHCTDHIKLQRGIRQGCPASAYLFILIAELLACHIRNNENLKGINVCNTVQKIMQFADDTVLLARDSSDIKTYLSILYNYSKVSGLKVNKSKTELVNLYRVHGDPFIGLNTLHGLQWCKTEFRYLGIYFCFDPVIMEYKNYRHKLDKIRNLLKIWRRRDLSLKGKVVVLKSLALSQLLYPMSILDLPEWVMEEANELFYSFLWKDKRDKIKKTTVIREIKDGGIKMIDIDSMARAMKCKWAARLYDNLDKKWAIIPNSYFKPYSLKLFMSTTYHPTSLPPLMPPFYRQCLYSLSQLLPNDKVLVDIDVISHQKIWQNKFLLQNRLPYYNDEWVSKGIIFLKQLFNHEGELLTYEELFTKYNIINNNINILYYYKICSSIPKMWKNILKKDPVRADRKNLDLQVMIHCKGLYRDLKYISNRELYWEFISIKAIGRVNSDHYWSNLFDFPLNKMKKFYYIPYQVCRETKIQSMQYKILHGIFPTGLKLFYWKKRPNPNCYICDQYDTLSHYFCECTHVKMLWTNLNRWWNRFCENCPFHLCDKDIILGVLDQNCHTFQKNKLIFWTKWFIYRNRHNTRPLEFYDLLIELKKNIYYEKRILCSNNKYEEYYETWSDLEDNF